VLLNISTDAASLKPLGKYFSITPFLPNITVYLLQTLRSGLQSDFVQMQSVRCFKHNQAEMLAIKVLISILNSCKTHVGTTVHILLKPLQCNLDTLYAYCKAVLFLSCAYVDFSSQDEHGYCPAC